MEIGPEQIKHDAPEALRAILSAREGAKYLNISYWKFLEEVKAGRLPAFKIGNRVLCRQKSLDLWVEQQEALCVRHQKVEEVKGKIRRLI